MPPIDFQLCVKCEGDKVVTVKGKGCVLEPLVTPNAETYQKFVDSVKERAKYGNAEYVRLEQRLHGLTADELKRKNALWHRTCYSETTHKQHTKRDQDRYEKAVKCEDPSVLSYRKVGGRPKQTDTACSESGSSVSSTSATLTRSSVPSFKRELCFYCQSIKFKTVKHQAGTEEQLHACSSSDVGLTIAQIVDASENKVWKLNIADILAEKDFLSRDIKYHKSCHTTHWRHYVQRHKRYTKSKTYSMEDTVEFISAEIEFITELQEHLDEGNILTLNEVASVYSNMMSSHGIKNNEITRKMLLVKINQSISNFTITDARGRKPAVIHSSETGRSSIDRALEERDLKEDMKAIFRCSKLIRQAILQSRKIDPWIFDGSLIGCSEKSVPPQLVNLIRWIIQGAKAGTTETRIKQLHKSCIILSQSILHACKTDKQVTHMPTSTESTFHCMFESPYAVGLSLYVYHNFRSQKAVSLLSSMGNGVSYDRVITICNKITTAIWENITEYGVYVPPGLLKNKRIRASMDNIQEG